MAQQIINNGESGLIVRNKLNDNFTELYTGKDSVTVANFAALPAPATVPGQRYWCLASQGVYLINRKPAGAYYSDGVAWTWLGDNPTTADQIGFVPAGGLTSTNVQAAIVEASATGVSSVSGTAPIASSGGATPAISISAATTSAAGSMSAVDKAKLDNITYQVLTADVTNATSFAQPTGLFFTCAPLSTYIVEAFLQVSSDAGATGVQVGLSAPSTAALVNGSAAVKVETTNSLTGMVERNAALLNGGTVIALNTTLPSTSTDSYPSFIRAVVRTGVGASGNFEVIFNSETTFIVYVRAGSTLRVTKVA
jgi:hypothetical protein